MPVNPNPIAEEIQQAVAKLLATSSAGSNLRLIGGFRYRFLDQSARLSHDIDYHWEGDLEAKQAELVILFARRLLPEIKHRLGFDGEARAAGSGEGRTVGVRGAGSGPTCAGRGRESDGGASGGASSGFSATASISLWASCIRRGAAAISRP